MPKIISADIGQLYNGRRGFWTVHDYSPQSFINIFFPFCLLNILEFFVINMSKTNYLTYFFIFATNNFRIQSNKTIPYSANVMFNFLLG